MSNQSVKESGCSELTDAVEELVANASESSFNAKGFFEKFALLANTEGAVTRLREIILELAVRGALVSQFDDEPCISSDCVIATREEPHLIPKSWRWVTFADAANIEMGNSPPGDTYNDTGKGIPLINGPVEFSPGPFGLTRKIKFTSSPTRMCKKGDLLICVRGSTTGRTNIAAFDACIGRGVAAISPKVVDRYVHLVVLSMRSHIFDSGKGSTFKSITQNQLRAYPIPLPPLAEQKRIVAKVDELMGLCDRLEALEKERKNRHSVLSRAALAQFADAPTASNLQLLFHESFDVEPAELRKTILTLAVRGKLIESDPEEEPIDNLLARMQKRRQQLIDDQSIRRPRDLPPVAEDELPFAIPDAWRWTRWGQICDWITYGFTRPMAHVKTGPPIVTAKNVQDGFMTFENSHRADAGEFANLNPKDRPRRGDILITKDGTIGRAAVVDTDEPFCINQSVAVLWLQSCLLYRPFMLMVVRSPFAQGPIWDAAEGMAIKHLSITDFGKMILPLPPLAEQKRIVAKVDELMALVDELERQLVESRSKGQQLFDAIVAKLTTASSFSTT